MRIGYTRAAALGAVVFLAFCSNLSAQVEIEFLANGQPAAAAMDESLGALNSQATLPFKARAPVGTRLRTVFGGRTLSASIDADESARRFLTDNSEFFRVDQNWRAEVDRRGNGRRAHLRFYVGDIEVAGTSAIVLQEDGEIVGAATSLPAASRVVGSFRLSMSDALTISRRLVQKMRARRGLPGRVDWMEPRSRRRYFATDQGLLPCWQVEERTVLFGDAYALFIDAQSGDLLQVAFLIDHGTASYPYDSEPGGYIAFNTTDGEGKVFKSQGDARKGKASKVTLKNVSKGVPEPSLALRGYVVSARVDTWDYSGNDAYNPKLKWNYSPYGSGWDYDHFDQVNTMFQIEKFYKHLKKALGQNLATNFSIPVLVNVPSVDPNAYFSTSLFPGGHTSGYLAFFDLTASTLDPAQDVSRDPTVVCHEYTHAWLHYESLNFTSNLDEPPRAVNEAVADFFAVTYHKDTAIGRYCEDQWPGSGIKRNLQDSDRFPETTVASMAISQTGLPEEHMNGEVFGSFLIDMRKKVGNTRAENIVFDTFPYWPHQMVDVGYGTVDVGNCVAATEEFFAQCVAGMFNTSLSAKDMGAIIGAAAARGITNTPTSYYYLSTDLETCYKRKFKYWSSVVRNGSQQSFFFRAQQGRTLKVSLVGKDGSGLRPDFTLEALSGNPDSVLTGKSKVYKHGGRVVKQEGIQLQDAGLATYRITISDQHGGTGKYTLTIDA